MFHQLKPGFLSNRINRQARKASKDEDTFSSVHNLLVTSANVLHKSEIFLPKLFYVKFLLQPPESMSEGSELPLVLIVALPTSSSSILSNFMGCTFVGRSGRRAVWSPSWLQDF